MIIISKSLILILILKLWSYEIFGKMIIFIKSMNNEQYNEYYKQLNVKYDMEKYKNDIKLYFRKGKAYVKFKEKECLFKQALNAKKYKKYQRIFTYELYTDESGISNFRNNMIMLRDIENYKNNIDIKSVISCILSIIPYMDRNVIDYIYNIGIYNDLHNAFMFEFCCDVSFIRDNKYYDFEIKCYSNNKINLKWDNLYNVFQKDKSFLKLHTNITIFEFHCIIFYYKQLENESISIRDTINKLSVIQLLYVIKYMIMNRDNPFIINTLDEIDIIKETAYNDIKNNNIDEDILKIMLDENFQLISQNMSNFIEIYPYDIAGKEEIINYITHNIN